MKFVFALALAFGVATICNAVPFKQDDTPQLKEEGQKFVDAKLEEFNKAASTGKDLQEYFNDLLTYVKRAQSNNGKLIKTIKVVGTTMKTMTSLGVNFVSSHLLHGVAWLIDGNRDNVSYYVLDYSSKWLEARIPSAPEGLKYIMKQVQTELETARDNLDGNAQVFVKGIKNILEWTANGKGSSHAQDIKNTIADILKGTEDKTLIEKTDEAVKKIETLAKNAH